VKTARERSADPDGLGLERQDLTRIRELQGELRTLRLDDTDSSFAGIVSDVREAIGMTVACCYGLRQRAAYDAQELDFAHWAGGDRELFVRTFSSFIERQTVNWAHYNTARPEASQRNKVVAHTPELNELAENGPSAVVREVFPVVGIGGHDQLRVVVCDGPSLLGWFGGFQPARFETRQQRMLAALVPDLRRRLVAERQLENGARHPLLDLVLEAIGSAAVVVDQPTGRVREANSAARARLDSDGRALRDELRLAAQRGEHPSWVVTSIELRGGAKSALLVARTTDRGRAKVEHAATRWGLTGRQREILAEVAEGQPNRTIAAVLGISERTVEVHVTALLDKAQVESRAELIVAVYTVE
jgi:DNA-binding CsgD family transcriptional regulator